jgi:putative sugar O-methyltransferase
MHIEHMNRSLNESIKDLIFLKENNLLSKNNNKDIWTSRANQSQSFFKNNLENNILNFRRNQFLINELPRFKINLFDRLIPYKNLIFKSIIQKHDLLNEEEKKLINDELKFSEIGNPYFISHNGVKFNKRWIHNIHYIYLIKKYLNELLDKSETLIIDIGGGYGILGHMLNRINFKGTYILVEFPEQLIVAQYFLKSSLLDKKISSLEFFYNNLDNLDDNLVRKFNIFLCPCEEYNKLNLSNIDLVTNFFSFGEMEEKNFKEYFDSNILKNTKYIFFINRFYSHNEYDNNISILNYNLSSFKKLHFDINKFEDNYIKKILRYFGQEKKYNTQFFEFIGKNEK